MDEAEMYYRTYAEIDGGGDHGEDDHEQTDSEKQAGSGSPEDPVSAHETDDSHNPLLRLLRRLAKPFLKSP